MRDAMTTEEFLAWLWKYTHGAARTWAELLGCLAGVNLDSDGLECTPEQDEVIGRYTRMLTQLRAEGSVERETASDPRYDLWKPVRR